MASFLIRALDAALFAPLFALDDDALAARHAQRRIADADHGYPCRVSLRDARAGEELLLLNHLHHASASPYRASGPIFVRRDATTARLQADQVPDYVATRLISLRGYTADGLLETADVVDGRAVGDWLWRCFDDPAIAYVHLHNARHGCYSCRAERAG